MAWQKEKETMRAGEASGDSNGIPTALTAGGAQHSPLPWRQHHDDWQRICDGDPLKQIARTFAGSGVKTHAEAVENARYIVQACNAFPELVAALAEVTDLLASQRDFQLNNGSDEEYAAVDKARGILAVLAKSEGK